MAWEQVLLILLRNLLRLLGLVLLRAVGFLGLWPSLLSLSMREGETLKTYSDKYWEMFNEIDGDFDDVAISTFKLGLPADNGLRKSLTGKPVTSVRQLMDRIDKYNRVEKDQQQDKGKGKFIL